jgi:hypothetical protein
MADLIISIVAFLFSSFAIVASIRNYISTKKKVDELKKGIPLNGPFYK